MWYILIYTYIDSFFTSPLKFSVPESSEIQKKLFGDSRLSKVGLNLKKLCDWCQGNGGGDGIK